jgi:cell division protease FtsH
LIRHVNFGNFKKKSSGEQTPAGGGCIWFYLLLFAGFILVIWLGGRIGQTPTDAHEISYSAFRSEVREGNVRRITVRGQEIEGEFRSPRTREGPEGEEISYTDFASRMPAFGDEALMALLEEQGVEIAAEPERGSAWMYIVGFLPFLLLILFFLFLFRMSNRQMQAQGRGLLGMGRSRAKEYDRSQERTTFDDVAGAEGAKTELREIVEFLRDPGRFHGLGGEIPRGVLLLGPPGTGKTLLARAVAGEANVPFFSISGSDFMEMLVGVGASRVRDLFNEAKKSAPAIIFIDELDSIGRKRGAGLGGGHDEREQTLNQLLSEMDGFERRHSVIVMAATNRPDILDPALLRPGRFDRRITVDLPTLMDRVGILQIHARNKPMASSVDLEKLARATPGFSGADLQNLLNEAALLAGRKNKKAIDEADIEEAVDKVVMGLARENLSITDEERLLLAYHEAGHAVVAALMPHADPIHKVSIVPRGRAMGLTQQLPEREKYIYPREYLLDRLAVMMGGRAAEELVIRTATSGAEDDLRQATRLARKMVLDWGMSRELGTVSYGEGREQVFLGEEITQRRDHSEVTAREIDEEVRAILIGSFEKALNVLKEHRQGLDRLAELLLQEEEVSGETVCRTLGVDIGCGRRRFQNA